MGDLTEIESSGSTKLVGSDLAGDETTPVGVSDKQELWIRDTHDNGGVDTILNLTTSATEGKVGGDRRVNRKYVIMEALDKNIKWGFSNSTQSFDLFKKQLIMVPVGENTEIWLSMSSGTGSVSFAELS